MATVIGIDGGGTKTVAVVARDGKEIGRGESAGTNLNLLPEPDVQQHLRTACEKALSAAGIAAEKVESVCAGVAGATSAPEGIARITAMLKAQFACAVTVVNDVEIALEAAFKGAPGVAVICGTGSIVTGRNENGESARAGGWGSQVSDEGSGTWIGRLAASLALRACDSGQEPEILKAFYEEWGVSNRDEFVKQCNSSAKPPFAALSRRVIAAGEKDHLISEPVLERAGRELGELACIVVGKLWYPFQTVEVAMLGGVFNSSELVRHAFSAVLVSEFSRVKVTHCESEPVTGALWLAEKALQK